MNPPRLSSFGVRTLRHVLGTAVCFTALALLLGCASSPGATPAAATSTPGAPAKAQSRQAVLDTGRALQRIGFGSCLDQKKSQPILDAVLADEFELFLFLGDNVYGDVDLGKDGRPADLRKLQRAYEQQTSSEKLEALRAATPILATWDDHDYGVNDGGADFAGKEGAQMLFEEFWGIPPEAESARRPGVYDAVIVGPPGRRVQVLLLDTRFFRSPLWPTDQPGEPGKERYVPDPDPGKTMLGQAQWRWLEERLREPAQLRLLVSSVQVLADGHGFEGWHTLPAQRQRLFDLLRESAAEGVVLLSGDRHRAGIYRSDTALPYPLYETTSSSLNVPTSSKKEEAGPRRLGPTYLEANYGAITLDWDAGIVDLEVRDLHGETVLWQSLSLDRLRP